MSNLSYLEKLLDGVNVEWKSFGEIAKIQRGASPRPIAKFITDDEDGVPWIKIGDTESGSKYVEQTAQKITKEGATKSRVLKKGDFIISNSMSFGRPYILNITGAIHDGWASISEFSDRLNSDFLYHYLSSQSVQNYWISKINSGSVSNLNADIIKTLPVPIPCPNNPEKSLAIQAEIVRILDAFTAMNAELNAELNMRKKQYNYYRDQLLSFEDGEVEWRALSEMAEYSKARISYTELDDSNYVGVESLLQNRAGKIDSTRTPDSGNLTQYNPDDILIGNIRPYLKKIWHADRVGGTNGDVLVVHPTDTAINPRYLYQVLADDKFFEYNMQHAKGAKMPRGNKPKIMEYLVPIPFASDREKSLSEQKRIVTILDKFDTLTSSITEGLPREIELRQKQYEYYRDLLLSFPKSNEGAA
ncbi:restriction endonuclease subunit S [Vibrio parahaemolyticus]|uniref:restriction endonuclease subunit S n=1 Tax=Vibrio parahaemolyticus TaxID=670 RepID=UPI0023605218|nr:restriction endonuclease subunit S [Vibrio parahaemolyticus]